MFEQKEGRRNVPAKSHEDPKANGNIFKLTKSQLLVYYWLIANSNWNAAVHENHYFIYTNKIIKSKIIKETGIKSPNTITSALKKLETEQIIKKDIFGSDAYIIVFPTLYVPMSITVLKVLLSFHDYVDTTNIITAFALLVLWLKTEQDRRDASEVSISFTKADLGNLLGMAYKNVDNPQIVVILSILKMLNLITITTQDYTNRLGVKCVRYIMTSYTLSGKHLTGYLDEDDEMNTAQLSQIWENVQQECHRCMS